jgi:hypothetical protein
MFRFQFRLFYAGALAESITLITTFARFVFALGQTNSNQLREIRRPIRGFGARINEAACLAPGEWRPKCATDRGKANPND